MAVQSLQDNPLSLLGINATCPRPNSVAETIQVYHKDVPPPTPLKDSKFRKLSSPRSSIDSRGLSITSNMYSSLRISECEQDNNPYCRDSVLDFEFGCYFGSKVEDDTSHFTFDHGSTDALLESCCPSEASHSTTSPRQSLLPPFPQQLPSLSLAPLTGQSPFSPPQKPLPAPPFAKYPVRKPDFESPSKRSISPLELEQLRQISLAAQLSHGSIPSPPSAVTSTCTLLDATSFSYTSSSTASSNPNSPMSSFSNADTVSPPTTAESTLSALAGNGSMMHKSRKPVNITQPESLTSTVHGRTISLPMQTKSTSPISGHFDLDLPSHDSENRRQSPAPPTTDTTISTPLLLSSYTSSLVLPTTPFSNAPLVPHYQGRPEEISAFDSDSDDEGIFAQGIVLRKMRSHHFLAGSRARAETVPTTNARKFTKGSTVAKRISKQDIKIPDPVSENTGTGCDIAVVRTSEPSSTAATGPRSSGPTTSPTTLRQKVSNRESSSPRSKRTSKTSRSSKKSGTSTRNSLGSDDGTVLGTHGMASSGRRFRSWLPRLFRKKNAL